MKIIITIDMILYSRNEHIHKIARYIRWTIGTFPFRFSSKPNKYFCFLNDKWEYGITIIGVFELISAPNIM